VFSRPLFELPFNRDVALTVVNAETILGSLQQCRRMGGVVVVAPEQMQSLELKCVLRMPIKGLSKTLPVSGCLFVASLLMVHTGSRVRTLCAAQVPRASAIRRPEP
jgi:hypothetical protein